MYKGAPILLDYSATKGAITAFTRSLSENLVEDGIRVNAVAPGPIWTPLNPYGGQPPEKMDDFGKDTPMGRPGQPNEVAPSFLFLACEDSSYMSGPGAAPQWRHGGGKLASRPGRRSPATSADAVLRRARRNEVSHEYSARWRIDAQTCPVCG